MNKRRSGQASLETTVAVFCGLLLLLATMKVFFWFAERLLRRQQYYENTRGPAGRQGMASALAGKVFWDDPTGFNHDDPNDPRRLRILRPSQ